MKKIILLFLTYAFFINGFSQTSKTDNIKKLLDLTGSGKLGVQVAKNMITSFKSSFPDVPDDYWNKVEKELNADTLVSLVIPIYEKYYSSDEIKQLTEFYQSPLGKKLIATMPAVMQESMQIGQAWGKELAKKVVNNLKEKGYIKEDL